MKSIEEKIQKLAKVIEILAKALAEAHELVCDCCGSSEDVFDHCSEAIAKAREELND